MLVLKHLSTRDARSRINEEPTLLCVWQTKLGRAKHPVVVEESPPHRLLLPRPLVVDQFPLPWELDGWDRHTICIILLQEDLLRITMRLLLTIILIHIIWDIRP
jgi:hypothetical protein